MTTSTNSITECRHCINDSESDAADVAKSRRRRTDAERIEFYTRWGARHPRQDVFDEVLAEAKCEARRLRREYEDADAKLAVAERNHASHLEACASRLAHAEHVRARVEADEALAKRREAEWDAEQEAKGAQRL